MKNEAPAANRLSECICLNLRMSARALSQIYDDALRPTGLRVTQFSLLRSIERLGPVTFQRLAELLVLDQTTMPRSLRLLEKDGYIRIEAGQDRRERLASLTQKGRSALEDSIPYWRKAQDQVRAKYPAERIDRLVAELSQMRRAVAE